MVPVTAKRVFQCPNPENSPPRWAYPEQGRSYRANGAPISVDGLPPPGDHDGTSLQDHVPGEMDFHYELDNSLRSKKAVLSLIKREVVLWEQSLPT